MKEQIKIVFAIEAGKYDEDGKNFKYIDAASNLPEALHKYSNTQGYDFRDLSMDIEVDGVHQQTVWLFGGPQTELTMRMNIACLWMKATGNRFSNAKDDWQQQLDEIEARLLLRAERWQDIHAQFSQAACPGPRRLTRSCLVADSVWRTLCVASPSISTAVEL